jgi:hypothetical protein
VLYLGATRSKKRVGIYVFWLGAALLTWVWAVSLKGLPPPGTIFQAGIRLFSTVFEFMRLLQSAIGLPQPVSACRPISIASRAEYRVHVLS